MDLHTRLQQFGGPIEAAPEETVAADVSRGRRAVRRRRAVQAVGGSTFAVAGIMAALAFTGAPGGGPGATSPPPAVARDAGSALTLVRYSGPQPAYFTIDKVPEGFFIQKDYYGGLTIAPVSARNPAPDVDPSKSPMYDPQSLEGKIAVYLEQKEYRGEVAGERITVGGFPAVLHPIGPTWQLIMTVHPDVYATLQFDVPLSREQILELGAGLHVHQDAIERMAAGTPTGK
jgi:hypothetical protein